MSVTEEEKQAYFERQRKEAEDRCRIRTQDQFVGECRKAGVSDDWYAFIHDRTKPVSL